MAIALDQNSTQPTMTAASTATAKPSQQTTTTTNVPTHATPPPPPRREIVYEDASFDDVPHCAQIATNVFAEVTKNMFRAGPTADQVAWRTMVFDGFLEGMLAFQQGLRTRPQRFVVARDRLTGRVVAFINWTRQAGEQSADERRYAQTDEQRTNRAARHPDVQEPLGFDPLVRESFVRNSAATQERLMGQRERCYIKYLCVDPNVQRTGAGRALLHLARSDNKDVPLFLECATTASAEQFYIKMGFHSLGFLTFDGAQKPLPCMVLEPNTPSLMDQDAASFLRRT